MKKNVLITVFSVSISLAALAAALILLPSLAPVVMLGLVVGGGIIIAALKDPLMGVAWIAFLLPFERVGAFELAGITVRGSYIVALAALAGSLLLIATHYKKSTIKNPTLIPLLLFGAGSIVSLAGAANSTRALLVFAFHVFVISVSLMITYVVRDTAAIQKIVRWLIVSCALVSLFGFYQFAGDIVGIPPELTGLREHYTKIVFGFPRIQSTALEPLYLANYLLIPIAFLLSFLLARVPKEKLPAKHWFLFALLALAGVNFVLTLSRGGYLALAFLLLAMGCVYIRAILKPGRVIALLIAGGIILGGAYGFLKATGEEKNIDAFLGQATTYEKGAGVDERLETYDEAMLLIARAPLFGVGPGNFGPALAQHEQTTPEKGWLIVNNEYLEILAEEGIVGALSLGALIILLFVRSVKAFRVSRDAYLRAVLTAGTLGFAAILVQYLTFSTLYVLHVWFLIGFLVAVQNIMLGESTKLKSIMQKQ